MTEAEHNARRTRLAAITPDLILSREVAIVGNSSSLRETEFGAEIDSFQDVLRFNGALTEDFSAQVGSKTTVQIIGIDVAYLFNPKYVRPSKDPQINDERRKENARRICAFFPDTKILTFSPSDIERNAKNKQYATALYMQEADPGREIHYFEEQGPGSSIAYYTANRDLEFLDLTSRLQCGGPRTGMKTVIRCLLSGIRPTLFGFDVDTSLEFARHYYDDITNDKIAGSQAHDLRGEMLVLQEMYENNLIDIRQ